MSILKNDEIVDRTQAFSRFDGPHIKCFDSFDTVNDILEIKNGGHDGVLIFVKLINNGTFTELRFGQNENVKGIHIDGNLQKCTKTVESARSIKIQNGQIIESTCVVRNGNPTGFNNFHIIFDTPMTPHL